MNARVAIVAAFLVAAGCEEGLTFTVGRELQVCEANLPTPCGVQARCVLDENNYVTGEFPGARRFIVHTEGEESLTVQILFTDRRAPGTELQVIVHEPSCSDRSTYDSGGQDLFRLSGSDGVLSLPFLIERVGDHLVELTSDAYSDYYLKVGE